MIVASTTRTIKFEKKTRELVADTYNVLHRQDASLSTSTTYTINFQMRFGTDAYLNYNSWVLSVSSDLTGASISQMTNGNHIRQVVIVLKDNTEYQGSISVTATDENGATYSKVITVSPYKDGADAISIVTSSDVIVHKYSDSDKESVSITVALRQNGVYIAQSSWTSVSLTDSTGLFSWSNTGETIVVYATIAAGASPSGSVTISIVYNGVTYAKTISVRTIKDGEDGRGIVGTNVMYQLWASSSTTPTGTWYDTIDLKSLTGTSRQIYLWSTYKTTYTTGDPTYTDTKCLGLVVDMIDATEVYQIASSGTDESVLTDDGWGESYTAEEGMWLWVASLITWTNGDKSYLNVRCTGRFAKDGSVVEVAEIINYYTTTATSTPPSGIIAVYTDETIELMNWNSTTKYLWGKERFVYSDGNYKETAWHYMAIYTENGRGVSGVEEKYLLTANATLPSTSDSGWSSTWQEMTEDKPYLWNMERLVYDDGTYSDWTTPVIIGHYGADGNGIASQSSLFLLSIKSSGVSYSSSDSWSTTFPTPTSQLPYVWKTVRTYYTSDTSTPVYSTPELVATYQAGVNYNLLENASFTSSDNIDAWSTQSIYSVIEGQTAPENSGIGVNSSERKDGRNSYYDKCSANETVVTYKEVLQQEISDKLEAATWYTFSFWARGWMNNLSVAKTISSTSATDICSLYLTAGRTYTLTVYGSTVAISSNSTSLVVSVVRSLISVASGSISGGESSVSIKFTASTTGSYTIRARMTETGRAYLNYIAFEDSCDLSTYIYPDVVDTSAGYFKDGEEAVTAPSDMSASWDLSYSWSFHTLKFKTAATIPDNAYVLFRLLPTISADAYRNLYICMPKLEVGMQATGFMSNSEDSVSYRVRGPVEWKNRPVGFVFESGKNGESRKDIVMHDSVLYSCIKGHTKTSSSLNPYDSIASSEGLWKQASDWEFVATQVLLAQYALIKNLGVENFEMYEKDSEGNYVTDENGDYVPIMTMKDGEIYCKSGTFNNITSDGADFTNATVTGNITATSGTFGNLKIIDGAHVRIQGTNNPYFDVIDSTHSLTASLGYNRISNGADGTHTAGFFSNSESGQSVNTALELKASGATKNVAMKLSGGSISGFSLKTKVVDTNTSLDFSDGEGVVVSVSTSAITITLPPIEGNSMCDGYTVKIKNCGSAQVSVKAHSNYIAISTSTYSQTYPVPADCSAEFVLVNDLTVNSKSGNWVLTDFLTIS